jgi:hypothetical protein
MFQLSDAEAAASSILIKPAKVGCFAVISVALGGECAGSLINVGAMESFAHLLDNK